MQNRYADRRGPPEPHGADAFGPSAVVRYVRKDRYSATEHCELHDRGLTFFVLPEAPEKIRGPFAVRRGPDSIPGMFFTKACGVDAGDGKAVPLKDRPLLQIFLRQEPVFQAWESERGMEQELRWIRAGG